MKLLVFTVFLGIFSAANYYVGLKVKILLQCFFFGISTCWYWIIFCFLASAYLIGRLGVGIFPRLWGKYLQIMGSYWLAGVFYLFLFWIVLDLLRLLLAKLGIFNSIFEDTKIFIMYSGTLVIIAVLGLIIFGAWNARHYVINEYEIKINKNAGKLNNLMAVMISDIHLGTIVENGRLKDMVNRVKTLNPDIVFFPGDIVDENVNIFVEQKMSDTFATLNPKYGLFAVPGNHEYIGGHAEKIFQELNKAGIKVLRDECILIDDSFYVAGRDDTAAKYFLGDERSELSQILQGINASYPLILMDHQPYNLEEAEKVGVDLLLSGHTHKGQFFPINIITGMIFENDWGILTKNNFHVIVSSGFGTWGPPIRIGNRPEIVVIKIHFTGK